MCVDNLDIGPTCIICNCVLFSVLILYLFWCFFKWYYLSVCITFEERSQLLISYFSQSSDSRHAYLHSQGLHVISAIGPPGEVGQVKLNLVPTLIQSHGHCANERLHAGCALIIAGTEPSLNVFVVKNLGREKKGLKVSFQTISEDQNFLKLTVTTINIRTMGFKILFYQSIFLRKQSTFS